MDVIRQSDKHTERFYKLAEGMEAFSQPMFSVLRKQPDWFLKFHSINRGGNEFSNNGGNEFSNNRGGNKFSNVSWRIIKNIHRCVWKRCVCRGIARK